MKVKSNIRKSEQINNKLKKNAALKTYYPVYVTDNEGNSNFALFTEHELNVALNRGEQNPEDEVLQYTPKWWHKILAFFLDI